VSDVRQPGGETTRKEERTMTVAELIDRLERCDPEATVRIMMQESWPFENSILGIAVRSDFADECECDQPGGEHAEGCPANDDDYGDPELAANDVFIVEGRQERYGSKAAWDVCR
jgi:hypothetical protein